VKRHKKKVDKKRTTFASGVYLPFGGKAHLSVSVKSLNETVLLLNAI